MNYPPLPKVLPLNLAEERAVEEAVAKLPCGNQNSQAKTVEANIRQQFQEQASPHQQKTMKYK